MTRPRPTAVEGELERRLAIASAFVVHLLCARLITLPAGRGGYQRGAGELANPIPEILPALRKG